MCNYIGIKYLNKLREFTPCFQYIFTTHRCDNLGLLSSKIGDTGIVCSGDHNLYSFEENSHTTDFVTINQIVHEFPETKIVKGKLDKNI
jgi:hypothetical protein